MYGKVAQRTYVISIANIRANIHQAEKTSGRRRWGFTSIMSTLSGDDYLDFVEGLRAKGGLCAYHSEMLKTLCLVASNFIV